MTAEIISFPKPKARSRARRVKAEAAPTGDPLLDEARRVFRSLPLAKAPPDSLTPREIAQIRQMLRDTSRICEGCPIASRLMLEPE